VAKNITLSADEELIERARARAREQHTSLNAEFRQWLSRFAGEGDARENYARIMAELEEVAAGGHFDRDELNER
jgi:hypothetical protein